MQLDEMSVGPQPVATFLGEVMRGGVVDNQEDLAATVVRDELFEELEEGSAVEDVGESIMKRGGLKIDGTEDVGCLPLSVGVNTWLLANRRPGSMQCAVEPEAGFVLEQHYTSAGARFFLMAGSRVRSQICCFSWSARANLLRGR